MGEICSFNERNDRYKGNLLIGIDNKTLKDREQGISVYTCSLLSNKQFIRK